MPMNIAKRLKIIDPTPSKRLNLFLRQPVTIKETKTQSGKFGSIPRDRARTALPPGKRISKFGNIYYETRRNRSDLKSRL